MNQAEIFRPWQGVSIGWPTIGAQKFTQYFRLEEQFIYRVDPWSRNFNFRFRYQLSTRVRFNRTKASKYLYMPIAAEFFFVEAVEETFQLLRNNSRFTIGLGYVFNYRLTLEGRFFLQRSRLTSGDFRATDQVFRLMIRHTIFPIDTDEDEVVH